MVKRKVTTEAPGAEMAPSPKAPQAPETFKARVLATGSFGVIDDVVELTADLLAQGVAAGQVDPHPDAVAYAASLK